MQWRRPIVLSLLALSSLAIVGCAEKKTRGVTFEGPESEVSLKIETTDKTPDDEGENN